jgi:maltose phosphorylase
MKDYILKDEWQIIEKGFVPEFNRISESIFSIGNGRMGQRANFEEKFSGDSLQGSYIAGVYYPDKTRVGWWKNGYPEYFAKIVNSVNWIGLNISIDGQDLDLAQSVIHRFERRLDMKDGLLIREVELSTASGKRFLIKSERFTSIARQDAGVINYSITPISANAQIEIESYLDGAVTNEDSNYDEMFWTEVEQSADKEVLAVQLETKKTEFHVAVGAVTKLSINDIVLSNESTKTLPGYASQRYAIDAKVNESINIQKYVSVQVSLYEDQADLTPLAKKRAKALAGIGFTELLQEHANKWHKKWQESDIVIEGDLSAQQAIRYNIFQLYQTYIGDDPRLNIGPKGFTGEKYGGVTYWDTEAYCLPFYLRTADQSVARNLLKYRYNHLPKAIENAAKLGFNHGAALYPMVTINGEECHNEWEITFEEIHRNGAIAYAIHNYINYTNDFSVIEEFALEVLIGISRFWSQRVSYSEQKKAYVMLGVTGPNEYENNVNNNWYTNTIAQWTLRYTLEQIEALSKSNQSRLNEIFSSISFNADEEIAHWNEIIANIYRPFDEDKNVFLQQDGFLDKELIPVSELPLSERPIHKKWSWDRILRSCYIKQADVLQGIYMLEDDFDKDTIERNFKFYEPLTVHESSLSASIHSILANSIGDRDVAYDMYLRTARLDLDDYNSDTDDGLHITSMGGTWMSIVEGFAGLRVRNHKLTLQPSLPKTWDAYSFRIVYRGVVLKIAISKTQTIIQNKSDQNIDIRIGDEDIAVYAGQDVTFVEKWQDEIEV